MTENLIKGVILIAIIIALLFNSIIADAYASDNQGKRCDSTFGTSDPGDFYLSSTRPCKKEL